MFASARSSLLRTTAPVLHAAVTVRHKWASFRSGEDPTDAILEVTEALKKKTIIKKMNPSMRQVNTLYCLVIQFSFICNRLTWHLLFSPGGAERCDQEPE